MHPTLLYCLGETLTWVIIHRHPILHTPPRRLLSHLVHSVGVYTQLCPLSECDELAPWGTLTQLPNGSKKNKGPCLILEQTM
jgi:hypothetical protein